MLCLVKKTEVDATATSTLRLTRTVTWMRTAKLVSDLHRCSLKLPCRSLFSFPSFPSFPSLPTGPQTYNESKIFKCVAFAWAVAISFKLKLYQLLPAATIRCRGKRIILLTFCPILQQLSYLEKLDSHQKKWNRTVYHGSRTVRRLLILQRKLCQSSHLCAFPISSGTFSTVLCRSTLTLILIFLWFERLLLPRLHPYSRISQPRGNLVLFRLIPVLVHGRRLTHSNPKLKWKQSIQLPVHWSHWIWLLLSLTPSTRLFPPLSLAKFPGRWYRPLSRDVLTCTGVELNNRFFVLLRTI
jgi:hypothetical protein